MKSIIYQLQPSELPIFFKGQDKPAFMFGEEGQNILSISKPNKVIFPRFEILLLTFQGTFDFLRERVLAIKELLKTEGISEDYYLAAVINHNPHALVLAPGVLFHAQIGLGALPLGEHPVPAESLVIPSFNSMPNTYTSQLWRHEGKCPDCGDIGRLDPCGGAVCRVHGFYRMAIVPKPTAPPSQPQSNDIEGFPFEALRAPLINTTAENYAKLLYGDTLYPLPPIPPRTTP